MQDTKAIITAIYTQAKNREIHPAGTFDSAKRWLPDTTIEKYMSNVRSPSRAYPFSYMTHCRTKKFITRMIESSGVESIEAGVELYTGRAIDAAYRTA